VDIFTKKATKLQQLYLKKASAKMKSGSKRFTNDKLDKNLIISYDSTKPDKCLIIISTTAKDFIAEFEITSAQADDLFHYLLRIFKNEIST
jgi:hypothetical protein